MEREQRPFIYLYDLPRGFVTASILKDIIKKACGLELTDPIQFKFTCDISMETGLPSSLI